ncbi:integrase, catalytic region, zinc finger, CCHC-type containing protein [Tanacetum coccineum]|uniref:Integrase, catalytic region, zinc finger, CCHC-type containing protein n=1 Tax=Tanacetum coccineum TaxID=301880 RepID=A0ABQ5AE73_9ASTR
MSTQQDIYAVGFENRPPMLNKENYVPWSSHLLCYDKSRPNGKLIYNSIMNGPYVRRMIPKPGDPARTVPVPETFHEQTDDELTEAEIKQMEANDPAIQTILPSRSSPKHYAALIAVKTAQENLVVQNAIQNPSVQNDINKNEVTVVPGIANQNQNGNVVAARAEGNANGNNGNQIRCYNCRELGHLSRNCTVRPRRRDAAYLQTQLLMAQKVKAGIQLHAEELTLRLCKADLDEIEEVNANCILMANLQQASTSGTQTNTAPVYDSDGYVEVQFYENCYNDEIFNMFTQEEQYTELLEPIPEPHQVPQNDSNVISELSKEKSTVSSLQEEKKRLKSDFKIREDELLDKQIQLENKVKELDNILVKTGQSIQTMHMLSPKPDSFYHTEQKMALGYQNLFYLKNAQQKQQSLYNGKVLLKKHDPPSV